MLYDLSYANIILYGAVIPQYKPKDKNGKGNKPQEVIKADDPKNRDRVRKIIESFD